MKNSSLLKILGAAFVLLAACIFAASFAGCDSNTDSGNKTSQVANGIAISPTNVTVSASQASTLTFVATGGTGSYTWSVSTPGLGTITPAANGLSATYSSTTSAGVNIVEVTDGTSGAATATVTQQ